MFLTDQEYLSHIRTLISKSDKIDIAVAFWGKGSEELIPVGAEGRVRIICNLSSGGTNPDPIKKLQSRKLQVKQLNDLHAKVVLGSTAAIIGSANHSTNGLQLEGVASNAWSEAGILTDEVRNLADIATWFEAEWERARTITSQDIEAAQAAWDRRFANRPLPAKKIIATFSKSDLIGRQVFGVLWAEEASPEATAIHENVVSRAEEMGMKLDFISNLSFYEDWPLLPYGADLVSFQLKRNGKYKYDGVYRRLDEKDVVVKESNSGQKMQFVLKQKTMLGLPVGTADRKLLEQRLAQRLDELLANYNDGIGTVFPIHELYDED